MNPAQITETAKALQKAEAAGEEPKVLIDLLTKLKNGVKAKEEILRSTRIGVTVNRFKQNKNGEVARLATDLVRKWRDEVEREKISRGGGAANGGAARKHTASQGGAGAAAGGASTPNGSPAPAVKSEGGSKGATAGSQVAPDKRTWKTDKVDVNRTDNKSRDACIGLIYDGLVFLSTAPSSTVLAMALSVEEAAFKKLAPETSSAYKDKMRMLFQNLKSKTNPGLRARVLHGDIKPEQLVGMTHEELKSKEMKAADEQIRAENLRDAQVGVAEAAISSELECSKCKNRKVSFTQAQTRSADEPMTTFCTCTVCGKRWKFS